MLFLYIYHKKNLRKMESADETDYLSARNRYPLTWSNR